MALTPSVYRGTHTRVVDAEGGIVAAEPRRLGVLILGGGHSHREAPLDEPSWEVWSCNSLWKCARDSRGDFRADRWFELHPPEVNTEAEQRAVRECPVPIYLWTLKGWGGPVPQGVVYPLERMSRFGRYFTSTFAYQMALAIAEGARAIGLWGIELHQGTRRERTVERACLDYWIGVAVGLGVKVIMPDEPCGPARHPYVYGLEYDEEAQAAKDITAGIVAAPESV